MIALAALALASAAPPAGPPTPPPPAAQAAPNSDGGGARVIADFRVAEAERGPLDGLWRVASRSAPLYLIELADPGGQADPRAAAPEAPALEGAWGDLRRAESPEGTGYLAAAKRTGDRLTLLFYEAGGGARTIELEADERGRWRGEMTADGRRTPVVMARDPLFAAAGDLGL